MRPHMWHSTVVLNNEHVYVMLLKNYHLSNSQKCTRVNGEALQVHTVYEKLYFMHIRNCKSCVLCSEIEGKIIITIVPSYVGKHFTHLLSLPLLCTRKQYRQQRYFSSMSLHYGDTYHIRYSTLSLVLCTLVNSKNIIKDDPTLMVSCSHQCVTIHFCADVHFITKKKEQGSAQTLKWRVCALHQFSITYVHV